MEKCIIVAMSRNRVIGSDNVIPWDLPEDLARFKIITAGYPIIMGRKTHESIGRILPNRENIIVSAKTKFIRGAIVVPSIEEALTYCEMKKFSKIFFIGGSEIYKVTLNLVDRLYLTIIDSEIEGNRYFPEIDYSQFEMDSLEDKSDHPQYPYFNLNLRKKI